MRNSIAGATRNTRDELLEEGKFDRSGALVDAMVPWIKRADGKRAGLETALMGRIHIEGRKMTVEVNSAARAKTIRALIEQSLGERVRYRRTRKQPLESVVPPMPRGPGVRMAPRSAEDNELTQHPEEVRAQLEAVKDADGREMVEALLNQFERDAAATQVPTSPQVFSALRLRLGLKSRV